MNRKVIIGYPNREWEGNTGETIKGLKSYNVYDSRKEKF
jgi:hypothetical protein